MPFILIKGHFVPKAGMPDGDSLRFRAKNPALWDRLEGKKVRLGTGAETKGTVQLRLEGIDAIEKGAQKPLATDARDNLLRLAGFPQTDEPPGRILARMTDDKSGRPICFAFAGTSSVRDGAEVFLDAALLRDSMNHRQMTDGFAYPLYYNTLFGSLRGEFSRALVAARKKKRGYWSKDATLKGVRVTDRADLETINPIWPKLWRRLDEYLRKHESLGGFVDWLTDKNERIDVLSVMEERGFQDLVEVNGDKVRLTERPENLRVVADAGKRRR